jgi:hypothetical protein
MFELHAADVRFHHETRERDDLLRTRALRAERTNPEPVRRPRRASRRSAWPRPIALHRPAVAY